MLIACNGMDLCDLLDLDPVQGGARQAVLARLAELARAARTGVRS
ncbi:hypothetical protein BH23ACT9_BH23ACT9_13040 [soil metagenome]